MPTLHYYLRCGDLISSGVTERRNGHSDYATTTTMMMMKDARLVSKMEGKTNFSRHLPAARTGIVECLKIIDVGCNLKQFDVEADRKYIFFIFGRKRQCRRKWNSFLSRKTKTKVTCAYITELSYGSVAKITFFGPTQMTFSERKRKIKQKWKFCCYTV